MRAEPRHIDIRQSLKQLKTATIVTDDRCSVLMKSCQVSE